MDDRITDLESRLAHQERITEELSDVIARQDRSIDMLTLQLRRIAERLNRQEETLADRSPQDDRPPPHY